MYQVDYPVGSGVIVCDSWTDNSFLDCDHNAWIWEILETTQEAFGAFLVYLQCCSWSRRCQQNVSARPRNNRKIDPDYPVAPNYCADVCISHHTDHLSHPAYPVVVPPASGPLISLSRSDWIINNGPGGIWTLDLCLRGATPYPIYAILKTDCLLGHGPAGTNFFQACVFAGY